MSTSECQIPISGSSQSEFRTTRPTRRLFEDCPNQPISDPLQLWLRFPKSTSDYLGKWQRPVQDGATLTQSVRLQPNGKKVCIIFTYYVI